MRTRTYLIGICIIGLIIVAGTLKSLKDYHDKHAIPKEIMEKLLKGYLPSNQSFRGTTGSFRRVRGEDKEIGG